MFWSVRWDKLIVGAAIDVALLILMLTNLLMLLKLGQEETAEYQGRLNKIRDEQDKGQSVGRV